MADDILYHYTDLNGFLGIIQERKLRLTSAFNLNDSKEVIWAFDKIRKKLDVLASEYDNGLSDLIKQAISFNSSIPYVCSLTSESDLLSQWRAYSQDGKGVSIGIKRSALPELEEPGITPSTDPLFLTQVIYNENDQDCQIDKILESVFKEGLNIQEKSESLRQALFRLVRIAPTFKNLAFHEEKEWRIIYTHDSWDIDLQRSLNIIPTTVNRISKPNFRISDCKLITYFEYDLVGATASDIFAELVSGPKCETSNHDLSILLTECGCDLLVRPSKASYR